MWWALAGLALLAGVLALVLVPRARRRSAWEADLSAAHGEAAWFARELLPQLQRAMTPAEVAGGWRVAAGRVSSVEDLLAGLSSSAPDEGGRARAGALRDAVRRAHRDVDELLVSPDPAALSGGLAVIAGQLAEVLERAPRPD